MDHETLWAGFCTPPDEARPAGLVALDGRQRRSRGHPARPRVAAPRRRARRADVRRRHGHAARRPGAGAARVAGVAGRRPARRRRRRGELGLEFAVATSAGWSAAGGPWVAARGRDEEGGLVDDRRRGRADRSSAAGAAARRRRAVPGLPAVGRRPRRAPLRPGLARRWPSRPTSVPPRWCPAVGARARRRSTTGAACSTAASPRPSRCPGTRTARRPRGSSRSSTSRCRSPRSPSACRARAASPPRRRRRRCWRPATTASPTAPSRSWTHPGTADKAVPVRTVAFPPVTARRFRLVLTGASAAEGLPRLAEGVRLPPILRRVSEFLVSEFALFAGGRVHQAELKAGLRRRARLLRARHRPGGRPRRSTRDRVLDVTGLRRRGRRPALGRARPATWRVLRFGASLTGQTNGPAPPEATGLEVDKLDAAKVRRYLDTYLGPVRRRRPRRAAQRQHRVGGAELHRPAARAVRRAARLRPRCRGCRRWPGYVVGDAARTDRVPLGPPPHDRRPARERVLRHPRRGGARAAASSTTPRRSRTAVRSSGTTWPCAATPTCRWARCGCSTPARADPSPTYLADLKGASSVAHVLRQAVHRRGVDDRLPPPVELHPPAAQARRRPRARARRDPVLHPHLAAPADPGAAARHRAGAVPGAGVHPHRAVGGAGRAVDRLPGPLLVAAQPGRRRRSTSPCSSARRRRSPALFGEEPDRSVPAGFDFDYVDLDGLEHAHPRGGRRPGGGGDAVPRCCTSAAAARG